MKQQTKHKMNEVKEQKHSHDMHWRKVCFPWKRIIERENIVEHIETLGSRVVYSSVIVMWGRDGGIELVP